jgi:MFS family permease
MSATTAAVTRHRLPLYALLLAGFISAMGNALTTIAIPWFVLQTTGSATRTGITAAVAVLPTIIAGVFGGTLVDRLGYKRTSVVSDFASGATVAAIPLLYVTVGLAFWQLLVLVFLGALLDAPGNTARMSLMPDLAEPAGMRLERANSAFESVFRATQLLGPALAGALIAVLGASNVLWIDAATFAVSAALVGIVIPKGDRAAQDSASRGDYWAELAEGLRFVRGDDLIIRLLIFFAVLNFLGAPLFGVVLPVYANRILGSSVDLGLMLAGFGAGALAGSIAYGAVGHRLPRRATLIGGFLAGTLSLWVLVSTPDWLVAATVLAIAGYTSGVINPLLITFFHERVPETMRGRVFGLIIAVAWIANPAGMLVGGYLVERIGVAWTLLAMSMANTIVVIVMLLMPSIRQLDPIDRAVEDRRQPSRTVSVGAVRAESEHG